MNYVEGVPSLLILKYGLNKNKNNDNRKGSNGNFEVINDHGNNKKKC